MTYSEAYAHIDNLLDKSGTSYFTDSEKNQFLDLAIMEYTKGVVNTLESDAQSMEKVAPLVSKSSVLPLTDGAAALPTGFYHLLRAYTSAGNHTINIMGVGQYAATIGDPFHKADEENPIGIMKGSSLEIHGSSESIYVYYIAAPSLSTDDDFDTTTTTLGGYDMNSSDEIVNIAVRKMMLSLEDPRYQLQINELTAEKR